MRGSTLVFLGLVAAFCFSRHHGGFPAIRVSCSRCAPAMEAPAPQPAAAPRDDRAVRACERAHEELASRCRDLERSATSVAQSVRSLRDLCARHPDEALRAELAAAEDGQKRLASLRERTEVERAAALVRLQLARAGVPIDRTTASGRDEPAAPAPASPLDALDQVELPRAGLTSSAR